MTEKVGGDKKDKNCNKYFCIAFKCNCFFSNKKCLIWFLSDVYRIFIETSKEILRFCKATPSSEITTDREQITMTTKLGVEKEFSFDNKTCC